MNEQQRKAMELALEALEANHLLIHGSETKGGLSFCMDGYYSGCFNIDSNNRQTNEAITAIKEALAQSEGQSNFCAQCEALSRELKELKAQPEQDPYDEVFIAYGLPKQEQSTTCGEPVAWMRQDCQRVVTANDRCNYPDYKTRYPIPLYAAPYVATPRPQRSEAPTWIELTDKHPLMVFAKECVLGAYRETELADAAHRAVKAANGIKENT